MIKTLTTSLALYHLHHVSPVHELVVWRREFRKALVWWSVFMSLLTAFTYVLIVYL